MKSSGISDNKSGQRVRWISTSIYGSGVSFTIAGYNAHRQVAVVVINGVKLCSAVYYHADSVAVWVVVKLGVFRIPLSCCGVYGIVTACRRLALL